jgi:hypothetical protein
VVWSGSVIWPDIAGAIAGDRFQAAGPLVVAELALAIWAIAETYVRKNWVALLTLPVTWVLGLAAGLPLYLFLRTGRVR